MMIVFRLKKIVLYGTLIIIIGSLYGILVTMTDIGFPCVFHIVTGLQCPGCGITHMCIALMHLQFHQAFLAHPVIFTLLPLWMVSLIKNTVLFIRTGNYQLTCVENILLYCSIVILLVYGIVRNF